VTVPAPYALPATSSWAVADWLDHAYVSTPAGADGVAVATVPALPDNERWQLTHAVISCTSTVGTQLRLYLDESVTTGNLRDGSNSGNFNVADWPMGLWIPPGRSFTARWTGCSAGAVGILALQATILRRSQ
jgi:hypothetical protein